MPSPRMLSKQSDRARLRADVLLDLRNLIIALDRRLPRLLHPNEGSIATDAAELRARAVAMIDRLEALPAHPEFNASPATDRSRSSLD